MSTFMPRRRIHSQKICCESHEMFERILFLLLLPTLVFSASDLETACTGTDRVYSDGSCLVLNKTAVKYSLAKVSCEHYLGYSGHLVFIRSVTVQNTLKQLIKNNSVSNVYVSYEHTNTTSLRNNSWFYAYTNGSTITASFLPWKTGFPSMATNNDRAYFSASGVIDVAGENLPLAFVCEYEESLKQAVTDLEKQCAAISQVHVYNNGHCYVWHDERVNYFAAKLSCQEIPDINGHVIHIRNAEQVQMVETILKAGSSLPYTWVGLEQTNVSAADTQQPGSWFYSTPQESDEMATFLPWALGQPNDETSCQYMAYFYSSLHGYCDELASASYGFICEYESSRPMTTDLERLCNSTGVDADLFNVATPDGHCYIMHTEKILADAAKLSCNDLPGYKGHLVHIRSESQIGIVESLMSANFFTPFAWVGMEHTNKSSNRSIGWYYTTPEDSDELATFLPWSGVRPSTSSDYNNVLYYVRDTASGSSSNGIYDYKNFDYFKYICEYESTKLMKTDLEFKCASMAPTYYQAYRSNSCYVMSNVRTFFNKASLSCKHLLGYDGHLIHLRSAADLEIANNLIIATIVGDSYIWVGIEQNNLTAPDSKTDGWYYVTPSSNSEASTFLSWNTNEPTGGTNENNAFYFSANSLLGDAPFRWSNIPFICQYEEKSKRDVTPTEIYCQNTTGWYINGSCLIDGFTGIGNKTTVCPSVPSLASHPAHLSSKEKILVAQRLGRRYVENLGQQYSAATYATGLQQLKACAGNSCAEEPDKSWFYVTPEGYKFPANVYNASFWQPNASQDKNGTLNVGVITDTGFNSANALLTYQFICEYHEPWNFTNFEKLCLKTTNPSIPINNTCFTLNRTANSFTTAETQCNEFVGGHLAQITSKELATYLRSNLWANFGIPNNMSLYTNLRQFPQSPADEPDKKYYYVIPDVSNTSAVNPPWMPGQPVASGDVGSLNQAGELTAVSRANMQWSICQYDCAVNSAWTAWSACSQSCDKGIRSRKGVMYNISDNCDSKTTPATVYQYESCASGGQCKASSTKITTLKSECMSKTGSHYAYSSCYFLANFSGTQAAANDYCMNQGGQLASLFGEDLVSQLGSLFLQFSSVQAWIGLKYTSGQLKWMVDDAPHTLFKNISTPPTGSECYALVSDSSSPNATENPRLSPMACSTQLQQAICMKSDHIFSSYSMQEGKKVIEAESPESMSIEVDANDCGSRCSEIIGCVGFNFNPSDGSCIPTKVCPAMPSLINGVTTYTVQDDSSWIFHERI